MPNSDKSKSTQQIKKVIWKAADLSNVLSVSVNKDLTTGIVQFNSKSVREGDLFIALGAGEHDGHKYVADALANGASAAIVSQDVAGVPEEKLIKVDDTFTALRRLADYKRLQSEAKFIAITGSVGKTSTKDAMYTVLSTFGKCFVGRGNFNNHIGVPINLASMEDDIDFAIIELGMNAKDEIDALTNQVLPHFAIITNVAEAHLEFFKSVEEIAEAKCEIFNGLDLNTGVAIFPRDIDTYSTCVRSVDQLCLQNVNTIGRSADSDIRFISYEIIDNHQVRLKYKVLEDEIEFIMGFVPEHIAMNFAVCFAVCHNLKLELDRAAQALGSFTLGVGRGKIINTKHAGKNFTVISDYYNSNPASLKAALQNMSLLEADDKVVVIGDMGELGKDAKKLHHDIAKFVNESGASRAYLIGELSREVAKGLDSHIECKMYKTTDDFLGEIEKNFNGGEMVLIKGSRFMKLEKVAQQLGVVDAL